MKDLMIRAILVGLMLGGAGGARAFAQTAPIVVIDGQAAGGDGAVVVGDGGPVVIQEAQAVNVKMEKAAFLGVSTTRTSSVLREQLRIKAGLVVESVDPKSPAEAAGIKVNDIIEKMEDQLLINPAQFTELVRMQKPGDSVTLTVLHKGESQKLTAKLEEREVVIAEGDLPEGFITEGQLTYQADAKQMNIDAGGNIKIARLQDPELDMSIELREGKPFLTAKDRDGKPLFEGPIETPQQRAKIPANLGDKFKELEHTMETSSQDAQTTHGAAKPATPKP
jgi:hypothetical protein